MRSQDGTILIFDTLSPLFYGQGANSWLRPGFLPGVVFGYDKNMK
jgi:hypothetical protein